MNEVKQGGNMLPILFAVYSDDLKKLEDTGISCLMRSVL